MKALLLLLTLATTATAQTTWHNLRFGESRDEVRSALAAQSFPVETSAEGSLQSVSNYNILLPGMKRTLPLRADFHFTDGGGLMDITLSLDFASLRRSYPDIGGEDLQLLYVADRFNRALTDRYGVPLFQRPTCDADAAALAKAPNTFCTINWRDAAQSVELNWLAHPQRLFIRYQMLAADL